MGVKVGRRKLQISLDNFDSDVAQGLSTLGPKALGIKSPPFDIASGVQHAFHHDNYVAVNLPTLRTSPTQGQASTLPRDPRTPSTSPRAPPSTTSSPLRTTPPPPTPPMPPMLLMLIPSRRTTPTRTFSDLIRIKSRSAAGSSRSASTTSTATSPR